MAVWVGTRGHDSGGGKRAQMTRRGLRCTLGRLGGNRQTRRSSGRSTSLPAEKAARTSRTMLMTGVQNVERAWPRFWKARASRPRTLPVARHRLRLKLEEVVIGSAVLDEYGAAAEYDTCWRPCVASLHQLYAGNPILRKVEGVAGSGCTVVRYGSPTWLWLQVVAAVDAGRMGPNNDGSRRPAPKSAQRPQRRTTTSACPD